MNESLELVEKYADVIQIGARNMQNYSLLKRAGRAHKPVLLKRGMAADSGRIANGCRIHYERGQLQRNSL